MSRLVVDLGRVVHTSGGGRDIDASSRDGSHAKRAEPVAGCPGSQDRTAAYFAAIGASCSAGMPAQNKRFA